MSGGNQYAVPQPRLDVESSPLTPAGDGIDDTGAGHEDRDQDAQPEQREDREAQDLAERKQTVLERGENGHRRLQRE